MAEEEAGPLLAALRKVAVRDGQARLDEVRRFQGVFDKVMEDMTWSQRGVGAGQFGVDEKQIRRWTETATLPEEFARWLDGAHAWILANPPPVVNPDLREAARATRRHWMAERRNRGVELRRRNRSRKLGRRLDRAAESE